MGRTLSSWNTAEPSISDEEHGEVQKTGHWLKERRQDTQRSDERSDEDYSIGLECHLSRGVRWGIPEYVHHQAEPRALGQTEEGLGRWCCPGLCKGQGEHISAKPTSATDPTIKNLSAAPLSTQEENLVDMAWGNEHPPSRGHDPSLVPSSFIPCQCTTGVREGRPTVLVLV